jgi:two-component system KDP operon response regulator KdpE
MRDLNGGAAVGCRTGSVAPGSARVIVAADEEKERRNLRNAFEGDGYRVAEAKSVDQILQEAGSGLNCVLILAAGFGGLEPSELCRTIRRGSDLGIIVVDGGNSRQYRIDMLNAGADDYVASPFVVRELLARLRAVMRRVTCSFDEGHQIALIDRMIDLRSYQIKGPGSGVSHLTPKEHLVLQYLVVHGNQELPHQDITRAVWQRDGRGQLEYLRMVIGQLRRKLESDPDNPRYILTERNVGYRFNMPSAVQTGGKDSYPELYRTAWPGGPAASVEAIS